MTLQSFENWLGNAFYDLCFASYIQNELHETGFLPSLNVSIVFKHWKKFSSPF